MVEMGSVQPRLSPQLLSFRHIYLISSVAMPILTTAKLPKALPDSFFNRDAQLLACELLGKVIRHRVGDLWLSARIIETEAYYCEEKGSHASLGYTEKRKALFLDGGHIYMYYARAPASGQQLPRRPEPAQPQSGNLRDGYHRSGTGHQ